MPSKIENIVSWAKRRGFIFPSSEIYGGIGGVYDWGPYGVELKNNFKKLWWKTFVEDRDDVVGLESSILMNRKVWKASGHEKDFIDDLVECKKCNKRFKADDIPSEKCPKGGEHKFTESKSFNPMFKTFIGPVDDEKAMTYLRPETAQGMFVDFKQVQEVSRKKIPFGIAQVGKSFRNEINPKNYIFRTREFEIAEIEYFVKPGEDEKWFDEWLKEWERFYLDLGLKKENLVKFEHPKESLAHYSKRTVDLNYKFPFSAKGGSASGGGGKELAGVANRTDYDLKAHEAASGKDLKYFDQEKGEKYTPYVVEPTMGVERSLLALICDGFEEIKGGRSNKSNLDESGEVVLKIDPRLAPVKVAVLPLTKKLSEKAKKVYQGIKGCFRSEYDEVGSIGRRYRRQDEIGTPYCVTVDFDTEKDDTVTIRDRDTMKQERIRISEVSKYMWGKLDQRSKISDVKVGVRTPARSGASDKD